MTYDWRVNMALAHPAPVATNLGVISINEDSIDLVRRVLTEFKPTCIGRGTFTDD
jgi:hypothetical protein